MTGHSSKMCLIVDDEEAIRGYVRDILEKQNYQTIEASGGIEALRLLEKLGDLIDFIISDIRMPDGDGITFVCGAREMFPTIPVVLISAYGETEILTNRKAAFEFIEKPFAPATLLASMDQAIKMMELRKKVTA